jgi:dipeptidyl aminopeptidase/acylaminoacyl peptidase
MKPFAIFVAALLCSPVLAEPFSAEKLVRLDRVGAPALSPDGATVVYALRTTDMEANKGRHDLWLTRVEDGEASRLTRHEANDTGPAWSPDGRFVYFLSSRAERQQVWRIGVDGGEATQVTDLPLDVGSFRLVPDGSRLVLSMRVYPDCEDLECTVLRDQAAAGRKDTGIVYDRLFMRHWDRWLDGKRSQLFAVPLNPDGSAGSEVTALSHEVDGEVPSLTWGGSEQYAVSPDGSTLYFTAKLSDGAAAWSTNYDIYAGTLDGKEPVRNLTGSNSAWDTQPVPSPDGRSLAYLAMSRAGFEADRFRIMIRDLETGTTRQLAPNWDHSPAAIAYSPDGSAIYASAQDVGKRTLWRIPAEDGAAEKIVFGGTVSSFEPGRAVLVYAQDSLRSPSELFVLPAGEKTSRQITNFSGPQLEGVQMGEYEQFSFEGAGGDTVHGYVVRPAGFEDGRRYPVAFLIHGGPQGSFGDHFHYRWNPQTYAGQGFAAVFIDFHGSTGYGQDFTDSISGDWGGKPLEDLQRGLCALGASYGGFMINWIAGNWPDRFECLVNHDGVFDQRSMYYTTEELWFPEWDIGGTPFDNPGNYERFNPASHVHKWQTPMLVIHGQLDYRVPVTQGIAAFTALQRRGIPSRFLYFPDENHWVLKPHNSLQWHQEVNRWLHHYLNGE